MNKRETEAALNHQRHAEARKRWLTPLCEHCDKPSEDRVEDMGLLVCRPCAKVRAKAIDSVVPPQFKVMLTSKTGVFVDSLEAASEELRSFIDSNNYGASQLSAQAGKVYLDGVEVARISYNGRIWDMAGKPLDGMTADEWVAFASGRQS